MPARAGCLLWTLLLLACAAPAASLTGVSSRIGRRVDRLAVSMTAARVKHHQKGRRTSRVAQVVQQELAGIIRSGTVHGPRAIQEHLRHMISIVDVDVSPDLGNAKVKVSIIGDQKDKISAIRWLQSSAGPIRHVMAQELKAMRKVPRLTFVHVDVGKAVEVMVHFLHPAVLGCPAVQPRPALPPVGRSFRFCCSLAAHDRVCRS
jgi:ribosome-binding factor A